MAVKTAAELKAYFETGDVPTQQEFVDLIDTIFTGIPDYKVYDVLLTSNGAGALDVVEVKNTLGVTVTSNAGFGAGDYNLTAPAGTFTANKTLIFIQNQFTDGSIVSVNYGSETLISIASVDGSGTPTDGIINNTSLRIIVYN